MGQFTPSHDSTVLLNGQIFTQTPGASRKDGSFVNCMVVGDGVIQYLGHEQDDFVVKARELGAAVEDLEGQTVLPSFIDGHLHILVFGQSLTKVKLNECRTLEEIRTEIKRYAEANPDLDRILGGGWIYSATPDGVHAGMLDDLDPRPITIDAKDLHSSWCNTAALNELCRVMDLADDAADPPGGTFQRDSAGKLNGVFGEAAVFTHSWPYLAKVTSLLEKKAAIKAAIGALNAAGYTGLVEMAMDEAIWEPLIQLRNEEGLGAMRIAAYWLMKPADSVEKVLEQVDQAIAMSKIHNTETTPDCRIVGVKVICDGIVDACTASLKEPYYTGTPSPDPIWSEDVLNALVKRADDAGLQVALHAIGDRTAHMAINVLERHADRSRRPRIEHLELTSEEDAARLGKLGITASIQPVHSDPAICKEWPRLLGEHRCGRAFAYSDFADGGSVLAIGTDAPTAPYQPLPNLYVATTRRSAREPGLQATMNEQFALSLFQAIAGATYGSAYSCFADAWTGTLSVGLKADFVVCEPQLTSEKLIGAATTQTWFEGRKVYQA